MTAIAPADVGAAVIGYYPPWNCYGPKFSWDSPFCFVLCSIILDVTLLPLRNSPRAIAVAGRPLRIGWMYVFLLSFNSLVHTYHSVSKVVLWSSVGVHICLMSWYMIRLDHLHSNQAWTVNFMLLESDLYLEICWPFYRIKHWKGCPRRLMYYTEAEFQKTFTSELRDVGKIRWEVEIWLGGNGRTWWSKLHDEGRGKS